MKNWLENEDLMKKLEAVETEEELKALAEENSDVAEILASVAVQEDEMSEDALDNVAGGMNVATYTALNAVRIAAAAKAKGLSVAKYILLFIRPMFR